VSSGLRRGALAAAALAFSIASLAACGAGNNAQTLQIKPDNAATTVGNIKIQNALVITQPDRRSTGPAVISATLFNNGDSDETLDSVSVSGSSAKLTPANGKGKLTVPAGGSIVLGGKGNATAVLPSGREAVQDGNAQKVTFTFGQAGAVTLQAFVVPAESYFSSWGPSAVPTAPSASASASVSATPSTSPSGKPSAPASSSPSATPSDSASQSAPAGH
jgi:copper(I)-binding protein